MHVDMHEYFPGVNNNYDLIIRGAMTYVVHPHLQKSHQSVYV